MYLDFRFSRHQKNIVSDVTKGEAKEAEPLLFFQITDKI